MPQSFDAIVVGGGSGGLAFAKEAAGLGASVLLIERAELGGTCVNRGCVPKKMMWTVAQTLMTQASMVDEGLIDIAPPLDFETLTEKRAAKIEKIVDSFDDQLEDAGVTRVSGTAALKSGGRVDVNAHTYSSDVIVMATGTSPSPLDIEGWDLAEQSDDVFQWTEVPERLVVIGGGYIGCEMAAIFNAFGAEVTLVSNGPDVLTEFSKGSQNIAARNLQTSGVSLVLDTIPTSIAETGDALTVKLSNGDTLTTDCILNATGRDPNLDAFGALDLPEQAENGSLEVGEDFQTSTEGIYAVGDVANRLPLTPVAREDGKTLAQKLFGMSEAQRIDLNHVAATAFVFPPIGEVGDTDKIDEITTFTAMETLLEGSDLNEGWALNCTEDGTLQGVTVVGHAAADAISWAAQATAAKTQENALRAGTAVHPSAAEEPLGSVK